MLYGLFQGTFNNVPGLVTQESIRGSWGKGFKVIAGLVAGSF